MKTPIHDGILQNDLNAAGHRISGADLSEYAGTGMTWLGGKFTASLNGWVSVLDYGGKNDGVTDNTAAVQAAMAAAGSTVFFPRGNYFFSGSIGLVPPNISLVGANCFGPSETLNQPEDGQQHTLPTTGGTCFLLTANAGNAAGTPFISLSDNSCVIGISFYWPNQSTVTTPPTAYPWAIYIGESALVNGSGKGLASSVKYCNLVNCYQGIYAENAVGVLIEETRGQALFRGIKLEGNYSVTRLRGCYFDVGWTGYYNATIVPWQKANAIAFDLGRNDMTILDNCFGLNYKAWIHCYDDSAHNIGGPTSAWVQVRGGGGDGCTTPVWIEQAQAVGVDIECATITTSSGTLDTVVVIASSHTGMVRFRGCTFVGWAGKFGTVAGSGEVTVDNCYFNGDGTSGVTPVSFATTGWAVTGTGNFALRNNVFKTTQTHVNLAATLGHAVVTGNMGSGTITVTNSMGAAAVVANNTV